MDKVKTKLYWLDKDYKSGCIFYHLVDMDYDIVVSLDIGHGECVAFQYIKNQAGKWEAVPLKLNEAREEYIPSYIAYGNGGKAIIGIDAKEQSQLITYFKEEPRMWDNYHKHATSHKYGQLLEDFIRELWKNCLAANEKLRDTPADKVLITIGCPASPEWTSEENKQAYCEKARNATGYPHVTIIPESTAAIMSAIYSTLGANIDLRRGVAVYDLGSSTIDFTFILMGEVIVTRSLRLGGQNIDQALLEMVARRNSRHPVPDDQKHTFCKTGNLLRAKRDKACTTLRISKEKFFRSNQTTLLPADVSLEQPISVLIDPSWIQSTGISDPVELSEELYRKLRRTSLKGLTTSMANEIEYCDQLAEGIRQVQKTGTPPEITLNYAQNLSYTMDKDLMNSALTEIKWSQLDYPYTNLSWYEAVEKFFQTTQTETDKYGCGAVILTGGTSKVACVDKIAKSCYDPEIVFHEPDTSVSVARGMCHATGQEVKAAKKLPAVKEDTHDKLAPFFERLCEDYAEKYLFDSMWSAWTHAAVKLAKDGRTHTEEDMEIATNQKTAESDHFIDHIRTTLQQYLSENLDSCIENAADCPHASEYPNCENCDKRKSCISVIRSNINALSADVYNVAITSLPTLPENIILDKMLMIDRQLVAELIRKMQPGKKAKGVGTSFEFTPNPGQKNNIFKKMKHVKQAIEDVFMSKELSPERCGTIAKAFSDDTTKSKKKPGIVNSLQNELKYSPEFRNIFNALMDQQLEIALGIVLFQIFKESDMN